MLYHMLYKELDSAKDWKQRGPYQLRSYDILSDVVKDSVLGRFCSFLQSTEFAYLVSLFTGGVQIDSAALEICRFGQGNYTMAHDNDPEAKLEGLDLSFCLMSREANEKWDADEHGGSTHYLIAGETEEVVAIEPQGNSMALVYRDRPEEGAGILKFTQYVNHRAPEPMYLLNLTYRLKAPEEDDS